MESFKNLKFQIKKRSEKAPLFFLLKMGKSGNSERGSFGSGSGSSSPLVTSGSAKGDGIGSLVSGYTGGFSRYGSSVDSLADYAQEHQGGYPLSG